MPVQCTCQRCGKSFAVKPNLAAKAKYCSRDCYFPHRHVQHERVCRGCGKVFFLSNNRANQGRGVYCTSVCRRGSTMPERPKLPAVDRLMNNRRIDPDTGCWEWTLGLTTSGYGKLKFQRRTVLAHRLSAQCFLSHPLDDPLRVLHRCDNPRCFNPDHLFIGTNADNTADMHAKGRAPVGSTRPQAKLREIDIPGIRERLAIGESKAAIAYDYGVSAGAIWAIASGRNWKHVH